MRYRIGTVESLKNLPKLIEIETRQYIIAQDSNKKIIAYSAICPHQGGVVSDLKKDVLRCPSHNWTFDPKNGSCSNITNESLKQIKIEIKNEEVYINLHKKQPKIIPKPKEERIPPKITVVGSASLLIEWEGYNILTDPWIDGITMFDSWINYPPSGIKFTELPKIDAIWISHEHSDHFHEPTLSRFDKETPVYVPNFLDGRLEKKLRSVGFTNVTSMIPKKIYNLTSKIKAISFEPGTIYYDSIMYLQLGNFSILNVNDAGFNWSIKDYIHDVDMLCQQFSPATSYPSTWTHIDKKARMQLYQTRNQGYLRMLKQIATTCGAKYLLPFANFNELFNPEHLKYVEETSKNRPADVKNFFVDSSLEIIDILPGESWDGKNGKFVRRKDRKKIYQKNNIFSYIKKIQKTNFEGTIPTSFNLSHNEIKRYFESFSDSQLSKKVGAYTVLLKLKTDFKDMSGLIKFEDGKVTYQATETPKQANLTMICPGKMVQKIIREDLYWDEIISGYWCTFSRNPDIYNPHFEKVLHVPWKARQNNLIQNGSTRIKLTLSIADIIEKGDENIIKIFEKYGLFCAGCEFSTGETVEDGCRQHGIDSNSTKKLILELQNTIKNDQIQLN